MNTLAQFVDNISDDFQSTFSVVDENRLANLLHPNDLTEVASIIRRYLGPVFIKFEKTNQLKGKRDIWIIEVKEASHEEAKSEAL
jgi:hypothetical protein